MANFSPREKRRNPLIAIVGPTASGKSDLGVYLATKFNGEIISADSRQVYRGLDIGSGKITKKEMMSIPHHLLDVASPKLQFSVAQYQRRAIQAIAKIKRRDALPILVGGSPFYVYSVIDGLVFPEVKPNAKLRKEFDKLSIEQLLAKLQKLDPERTSVLRQNSGQQKNKRRLIRVLEIVTTTGKPVPKLRCAAPAFDTLIIGVERSEGGLKNRIHKRLVRRLREGMVQEVARLHSPPPAGGGLSWRRLEELGLEYRFVAQYLQQKISKQQMINAIQKESENFARRQMQWFKKDSRIRWIQTRKEAEALLKRFL